MKLKDRNKGIPGSFRLLIPEIGMVKPVVGTFSSVVGEFSKIVAKNPALAQKHGWPTNRVDQENWIDQRECHRLIAGGYTKFIEMEADIPPPAMGGVNRNPRGVVGVAGKASHALTGAAIWNEMFQGSPPVSAPIAEARAAICAGCPENDKSGGFKDWFVATVARGLTELVGIMNGQNLKTSRDAELGRCKVCDCPMRAKVWPSLDVIKAHMPAADIAKLDPRCWITK